MTNYEKIKNMNSDEMAKFINCTCKDCRPYCVFAKDGICTNYTSDEDGCIKGIKQWLEIEEIK